ncbi:MAG: tryptophan-rich sensory protein [Firmicutes bacterium]|nr:tryptophan-rich sensory protein [Bacillota bacterium]
MKFIKTIKLKPLIISLLTPLVLGGAVGIFLSVSGKISMYDQLFKPPLSPPSWVFPVVWSVLYLLMGLSSYIVMTSDVSRGRREDALWQYIIQLGVNLIWPVLFFYFELSLGAFIWIIVLVAAVFKMIVDFGRISRLAAILQIPYLLWLLFAVYLNGAVFLLNG